MENTPLDTSFSGGESREYVSTDIDEELVAKLYREPPVKIGAKTKSPTKEQLKILLDLWPTHNKEQVSRAIGVAVGTARRWYREATQKKD